ncbi:MAG TPA: Wzz/FepE/Etk N-terminal domain-containing protein, partial [Actinomycetota bacterium]
MSIQRLPRGPDQGSGRSPRSRSTGSSSSNQEDQSELSQDLELLWKQKWLIAGIAALMVALAALFTFTRVPIYTAVAKVFVKPTGINLGDAAAGGVDKLVSLPTEAELAQSTQVAELAAKDLGGDPAELLEHVSVSVPTGSQLLEVKYSDPDQVAAAAGADAFAEAYLEFRGVEAQEDVDAEVEQLNEEIAVFRKDLAAAPDQATQDQLNSQITLYQLRIADAYGLNTDPGDVVSEAEIPTSPSSPNKELNLALGLFAGLFIGVGVGLLRARLGSKLEGSEDLEDILQVPVLAVVPRVRAWRNRSEPRLETILDPHGPAAEAYRALRPVLMAAAAEQDLKIFMVVSPSSGEGKTTTASNLAVVLAQAEQRVALVSADLRRSRAHEFFGIEGEPGL